jgi:TonB family protein
MKDFGQKRCIVLATILSLMIHSIFLLLFPWLLPKIPANKRAFALEAWLTERKKEKTLNSDNHKRMVVTLAPPKESSQPKETHYLSDYDHHVDKEKKARFTHKVRENVADELVNTSTNIPLGKSFSHHSKKFKTRNKNDPLGIRPSFDKHHHQNNSSVQDYLPNVEEADKTELNSWQWRHASFFNRIKTRIRSVWSPQMQISRYDPQGKLLGYKDRVTTMSVTIDSEGNIKKLAVLDSSGVAYLDEEAEQAIEEAAPFPFPPKELFNQHDEFSFTFAFHIQINRGFFFDFDWAKD